MNSKFKFENYKLYALRDVNTGKYWRTNKGKWYWTRPEYAKLSWQNKNEPLRFNDSFDKHNLEVVVLGEYKWRPDRG